MTDRRLDRLMPLGPISGFWECKECGCAVFDRALHWRRCAVRDAEWFEARMRDMAFSLQPKSSGDGGAA